MIFLLSIAIACWSPLQLDADTKPSAYHYLAAVCDQVLTDKNSVVTTTGVSNKKQAEFSCLVSFTITSSTTDFKHKMHNVAFTYDNAVASLAFIAIGDQQRAKSIVDAIIYT